MERSVTDVFIILFRHSYSNRGCLFYDECYDRDMRLPSLQDIIRRYFRLPRKKLWVAALKLQRWPVTWWDEKLEERRKKEKLRKERIESLYPKKSKRT